MKKIVVGISGASGVAYGIRLLEKLAARDDVETHLIISEWAGINMGVETCYLPETLRELAHTIHPFDNMGSAIASGSYPIWGMAILPCSMKTLSAIANGYDDNLLTRAADVCIKERRTLVLCPRETPFSPIHLENMLKLSRIGVRIVPPIPGFYHKPQTIDDLLDHSCMKVLDQLSLDNTYAGRWSGMDMTPSKRIYS